jgi:hypothetical protein
MVDISLWETSARADLRIGAPAHRVVRLLARYFRANGGRAALSSSDIAEATGVTDPQYCVRRLRKLGWIGADRPGSYVPLMPAPAGGQKAAAMG